MEITITKQNNKKVYEKNKNKTIIFFCKITIMKQKMKRFMKKQK